MSVDFNTISDVVSGGIATIAPVITAVTGDQVNAPHYDQATGQWVYGTPSGYYGQGATSATSTPSGNGMSLTTLLLFGVAIYVVVKVL